jgi:DNA-binding NarL/FixJ family response regulator
MQEDVGGAAQVRPETRRTILVVDDHELVRIGLRMTIRERFGERFAVAEAATLDDALAFLNAHADETALLLLDLQLDDTRGLSGLHLVRRCFPALPVVIVSGSDDPRIRSEAALHGAAAYVPKDGGPDGVPRLLETIAGVVAGGAKALAAPGKSRDAARHAGALRLTDRQVQVLELVLAGQDNRAIATETGLALGTVKNCVSAVFLAFNVRSRAELIAMFAS